MGNKIGKRRGVDERYTRPQGLYDHSSADERKLKRFIQVTGALVTSFHQAVGGDGGGCISALLAKGAKRGE